MRLGLAHEAILAEKLVRNIRSKYHKIRVSMFSDACRKYRLQCWCVWQMFAGSTTSFLTKLLDYLPCVGASTLMRMRWAKLLDDEWPESIFHHVGSQSASYLLSVQCEVLSRVS